MNILDALKKLRDDLKVWVTNNLNALDRKIDEKTVLIDSELSSTSTNPVQNKTITKAINNIPKFSGDYNDLANAPNIAEDESGNMVIADESGNIIFKVDADGMHTTAVSINGETAATEKYVDDAVANIDIPDVDFTGYATEDFVTTTVDSAKEELSESIVAESDEWKVVDDAGNIIFSVDAEGAHTTELTLNGESAATESYVNNAIANIEFPTTDLTDYATKKYVDDAVGGIEIPDVDFTGYATETYVDDKVADLVNSAPEALDTLGELATALENHEDAYDALLETVGGKATHTDLENLKEELSESIVAEADEWKVVDNNGNIIFSVDADGAHTTSMTLNGQSVANIIDDKVDKVDGKSLSTNDFTNEYKNKLDNLNEGGIMVEEDPTVPAWAKEATKPSYSPDEIGALADTTVLADLADDATHRTVTDTEKANWNAKSEFSGDYNDLENAPNITEDGTGDLIIADANGNIIFRSNGDGFETTQINTDVLKVRNTPLGEIIDNALLPLVQGDENKSIREIAREEALKIETAAMEFMGTVTAFPTGLTANDKGHMYKVAKEFTVNNNISIPVYQEISAYDTNPVEIAIPAEYYESIPESGKLYIDYQTLFDGNIQGDHKISVMLDLDYFGEMSSTITVDNGASYGLGYGNVVTGARVVLEDQDSTGEENSTYGVELNINSVIFAQTVPVEMQGQTIKVGDTIIWDGYAWFVIPSGDDAASVDIDDKLATLKAEILAELKAYVDEAILNGEW